MDSGHSVKVSQCDLCVEWMSEKVRIQETSPSNSKDRAATEIGRLQEELVWGATESSVLNTR